MKKIYTMMDLNNPDKMQEFLKDIEEIQENQERIKNYKFKKWGHEYEVLVDYIMQEYYNIPPRLIELEKLYSLRDSISSWRAKAGLLYSGIDGTNEARKQNKKFIKWLRVVLRDIDEQIKHGVYKNSKK